MLKKLKQIIFSVFFYKEIVTLQKNNDLENKVVVITGASKGIGNAIASTLLHQNATIVAVARKNEELTKAFSEKKDQSLLLISGNVTDENDCKKIVQKTIQRFGRIDAVINNVGMFIGKEVEKITADEWEKAININTKGMFLLSKYAVPVMKKQNSGLIVNIGSKVSHNTNVSPKMTLYAAAKYAVEGFSLALEKELKQFGIRVSCIMPGTVNTVMSTQAKNYMSPYRIGQIIALMIQLNTVNFEKVIIKSMNQKI